LAEESLSDTAAGRLLLLPLGHVGVGVFARAPVGVVLSSGRVDIALSMRVHVEWAQLEDIERKLRYRRRMRCGKRTARRWRECARCGAAGEVKMVRISWA
jgi:hypothetical protein